MQIQIFLESDCISTVLKYFLTRSVILDLTWILAEFCRSNGMHHHFVMFCLLNAAGCPSAEKSAASWSTKFHEWINLLFFSFPLCCHQLFTKTEIPFSLKKGYRLHSLRSLTKLAATLSHREEDNNHSTILVLVPKYKYLQLPTGMTNNSVI